MWPSTSRGRAWTMGALACGTAGTTKHAISRHTKPNRLMAQNRPDKPNSPTSMGDKTSDTAKDIPMEPRSEEHTSELQSLMRISYAVFCLKKKKNKETQRNVQNKTREQEK